jgi:hypothetical protein
MAVFAHDPVQQRSFDRILDSLIPPSTPNKRLDNNGLRGTPHDKSTPIAPPEKKHYRLLVVLAFRPMGGGELLLGDRFPSRVAMVFAGRHREARPRQTRTGWIMAAKLAQTVVR